MKSVNIHTYTDGGSKKYSIHYTINSVDQKLITKLDSIIYKGHCDYYGIPANIDFSNFSFNITNSTDCNVIMFGIPYSGVYKIAQKVADELGVLLNANVYRYM